MPRHNPDNTPPERRRAPKGSRVGRDSLHHTGQSRADLEALEARWGRTGSAAVRAALRVAVESGAEFPGE